jgi:cysteine-rich repeat protein
MRSGEGHVRRIGRQILLVALGLGAALGTAGCLTDTSVRCDDGELCPAGFVCTPGGCVRQEQIELCERLGLSDGDPCTLPGVGEGTCQGGDCVIAICGNGRTEGGEACDDGNRTDGDGCEANCLSDEQCGNGHRDITEGCDDGNLADGDGCQGDCQLPGCGDGVLDDGERCDDGGTEDGDGCARNCLSNETCGNDVRDLAEECDDGNTEDGDGCQGDCLRPACGDGVRDLGEACDDGNRDSGDGCDSNCLSDETCGNGFRDPNEGCDDGNTEDGDGCQGTCQPPRCGDGILDPGLDEVCDDGNLEPGDGCSFDCTSVEACGDGTIDFARGETCDDGNTRNRDGCGGTCQEERYGWREDTFDPPRARFYPGIAYDAARQVVVMFGGDEYEDLLGDTWEWDGDRWRRAAPVRAPSVRTAPAMVYDAERRRVVLVGGRTLGGPRNDVWSYDGVTWTLEAPAPFRRHGHAATYDSGQRALVVFGGKDETGDMRGDTWELRDGAWAQVLADGDGPPPRQFAAMAYDPVAGRSTLYGGMDQALAPFDDTWAYDAVAHAWTPTGTHPSGARVGPTMAFDVARQALVLLGGLSYETGFDRTLWVQAGDDWYQATFDVQPIGRYAHGLTYDLARRELVAFGGAVEGFSSDNTTWRLPGGATPEVTSWAQVPLAERPEPRHYASASLDRAERLVLLHGSGAGGRLDDAWVYNTQGWKAGATAQAPARWEFASAEEPDAGRIIVFGGSGATYDALGDTWAYTDGGWVSLGNEGPEARFGHAMAYSLARHRVVLFGGSTYGGEDLTFFNDTWELEGDNWVPLSPAVAPIARRHHAMASELSTGRIIVFGGASTTGGSLLDDTWAYNADGTWELLPTPVSPTARESATLTFDRARGHVVLFGGRAGGFMFDDVWELVGDEWQELAVGTGPAGRYEHTLTHVPVLGETVLFGGYSENVGLVGDTWTLGFRAGVAGELCLDDIDYDGDGLAGCDDDECWRVCTPNCPPDSPPGLCDGLPYCGDGLCSGLETPRLCGDCLMSLPVCGDTYCDLGEEVGGCPGDCPS